MVVVDLYFLWRENQMKRKQFVKVIIQNRFVLFLSVILIVVLLTMSGAPAWADSPARLAELLQFTAGSHVLGFLPDQVYLVGLPHLLRVEFAGTTGVRPIADEADPGGVKTPSSSGMARPLRRVTYPNLWPGISLTYEATAEGMAKSTYLVEPHADVAQIRLRYNLPVAVQADGSLHFTPPGEEAEAANYFTESTPMAWQEIDGQRVPVAVSFQLVEENPLEHRPPALREAAGPESQNRLVGFHLGYYNPAYPLVIDPTYQWHTFMGGNSRDWGWSIAVDGSGNVYVTGWSWDPWNGPGGQAPLNAHTGWSDLVILKLNSSGAYQWHTFMGCYIWPFGDGSPRCENSRDI
jgi:hypothetical protein